MRAGWIWAVGAVLLLGCHARSNTSIALEAAQGKIFEVTAARFLVDTQSSPIQTFYELQLRIKDLQGTPMYLVVEYENPKHRRRPLVQQIEIEPWKFEIVLKSEKIEGLKQNRDYQVSIHVYSDPEHQHPIDDLTQSMRSQLDWNLLRQRKVAK